MGRGKEIREIQDFNRPPYRTMVELFRDIANEPLTFRELRFLLLENHELSRLSHGGKIQKEIIERHLRFRGDDMPLEGVRNKLLEEGKVLLNTTGRNRGKPMTVNGLNRLLQTMKDDSKPKVLEKVEETYRLSQPSLFQLSRAMREERIFGCPDNMVSQLRGEMVTVYNIVANSDLKREFEGKESETYRQLRDFTKGVIRVWAKQKVGSFAKRLQDIEDIQNNGNFLGYCYDMVRWFIGSLGLDEDDFKDDLCRVEKLASDDEIEKEARTYRRNINACKRKLKEKKVDFVFSYSGIKGEEAKLGERRSQTSLLGALSMLSTVQNIPVSDAIRQLVTEGRIGKTDGDCLLMEQDMIKLYGNCGLHSLLSSKIFDEEPIIVLDTRLIH
jgi:hypothetical protein